MSGIWMLQSHFHALSRLCDCLGLHFWTLSFYKKIQISTIIFILFYFFIFCPSLSTLKEIQKHHTGLLYFEEWILENITITLWIQNWPRKAFQDFVVLFGIFPAAFHCLPCWRVIKNKEKINLGPKHIPESVTRLGKPEAVPFMCQNNQSSQKENTSIHSIANKYLTINSNRGRMVIISSSSSPYHLILNLIWWWQALLIHRKEEFDWKFYFRYLYFNWVA